MDAKDWAELMPGYMHVRVESDMLISRSSEPKDDIVERDNRFYVYLKPQGADDRGDQAAVELSGHATRLHSDAAALMPMRQSAGQHATGPPAGRIDVCGG